MILIRNCPHENGIYTLLDGDKKQIIKSTYSTDGITRLIKEHNGYKWYFERIGYQEIKNSLFINIAMFVFHSICFMAGSNHVSRLETWFQP